MIKVLVVDDSALLRKILSEQLSRFTDIQVVGTAVDPFVARDKIARLKPDVLTLDLEMPRMDGLTFLAKLMDSYPMPVVVVSSLTPEHSENALKCLELGAVEVVCKPGSPFATPDIAQELVRAIRTAAKARVRGSRPEQPAAPKPSPSLAGSSHKVIALGASTGGTQALEAVLRSLPADSPGIAVVQHMPPVFTAAFARRLDSICALGVREARDGDPLARGQVVVAPGGRHLFVVKNGAFYQVRVKSGPLVHHQQPSVDVLFHSVAAAAGRNAVGVLMTGMGSDGAAGLLDMREKGGHTIAQDEKSCVVYGMPAEAVKLGAACEVVALDGIAASIEAALSGEAVCEKKS